MAFGQRPTPDAGALSERYHARMVVAPSALEPET